MDAPRSYLWQPFVRADMSPEHMLTIVEGSGVYVTDKNGRAYMNCFSGLSLICGLGREEIIDAIHQQMNELAYCSIFRMNNRPAMRLAQVLAQMSPTEIGKVILTNSGAEAVEAAIKLSRQFHHIQGNDNRRMIISLENSYHGTTFGAFSVSGIYMPEEHEVYGPVMPGVAFIPQPYCYRCPFSLSYPGCTLRCASELERIVLQHGTERIAAFLVEPVQAAGGVIVPPDGYFHEVVRICREHDILLIVDESATGFGRTGKMFACQHWGIEPDMLIVSKGISGGYLPLGALLVKGKIYEAFLQGDGQVLTHGSSQAGNPSCAAAALATIRVLRDDNLVENARSLGVTLFDKLQGLWKYPCVGDIRGLGLMLGVELVRCKTTREPLGDAEMFEIYQAIQNRGLILHSKANRLTLFPPLSITTEQATDIYNILDDALGSFTRSSNGDL